jgi:pimeloyl-ACP methyl ester carboxylesterase
MIVNVEGVAINVATASPNFDPAHPSVILVHGAANDRNAWRDLMPALAGGNLNVFAPDLPGHGLSGGTALSSIESIADWLPGQPSFSAWDLRSHAGFRRAA